VALVHVTHPLLKPEAVEFRGYQANLARIAAKQDTLVVLPTGMGKTIVALLALADAIKDGAQRILVLAPTKPLVEQHGHFFARVLAEPWASRVRTVTGHVSPEKRKSTYSDPGIVCATPQVVQNDVLSGTLDLATIDWVVFDEAHRAAGDYPYVFLGQELLKRKPQGRRLGLTASPGHDVRKIDEVRASLGLPHVEIRTPADGDVSPYVQEVGVEWETLPLPPTMARVSAKLTEAFADRVRQLKALGQLKSAGSRPGRRDLLEVQGKLQTIIKQEANPDPSFFSGLSLVAQAMKLQHAIEQVETQGAAAFVEYLEGIRDEANGPKPSKASRSILDDARVNEAYHIARFDDAENPKMGRTGVLVQDALEKDPKSLIIVFTHYRSTCENVVGHLAKLPGVRPVMFVGQGKRGEQAGLTQKQQADAVERFKRGEHNVLVATSVAEEGLDIPETDLVVFYEPIPSEIRSIQRRGRTGRKRAGRVVVLMTKGTQDEAAHWASRRKEKQMVQELHTLRGQLTGRPGGPALVQPLPKGQATLDAARSLAKSPTNPPMTPNAPMTAPPSPSASSAQSADRAAAGADAKIPLGAGPRIVLDHREQAGGVTRHLHALGAQLEARQLDVGDFVLSDRVVVERKTATDFIDSLIDGRLFEQLKALKSYPRPFVVIEGDGLYGVRNLSAEAVAGALAAITVDHGIPVLQTKDALETARFLASVAKREQQREGRKIALRPGKPLTDDERQLFLLGGLPGVSDVLARRLLERFGSVLGVFNASVRELADVEGLGPQKASEIRRLLELEARQRAVTPAKSV
jgi:ERCC4-related helicase/ERCC4-type nuclease